MALQIAKAAGVSVIATTSSNEKGERLKELGADHVINYAEDQNWSDTVNKISGGGVDHVIDIGGGATLKDSINAARTGGHISLVGILGGVSAKILVPMIFSKQLEIHGVAVGNAAMQEDMTRAFEAGQIKPVIDRDFDLADTAAAFALQTSAQHFGKIVLSMYAFEWMWALPVAAAPDVSPVMKTVIGPVRKLLLRAASPLNIVQWFGIKN